MRWNGNAAGVGGWFVDCVLPAPEPAIGCDGHHTPSTQAHCVTGQPYVQHCGSKEECESFAQDSNLCVTDEFDLTPFPQREGFTVKCKAEPEAACTGHATPEHQTLCEAGEPYVKLCGSKSECARFAKEMRICTEDTHYNLVPFPAEDGFAVRCTTETDEPAANDDATRGDAPPMPPPPPSPKKKNQRRMLLLIMAALIVLCFVYLML